LLALLPENTNADKVLRAVQDVAVLVQGCWVVKSELLYQKNACSPYSGIGSEVLTHGRDYIMWMFTKSRTLNRKEIIIVIKLPREDLKEILEQMATWHATNGWEFMLPSDTIFPERYPDVFQRQQNLWNKKSQQLLKLSKINKESPKKLPPEIRSPRQRRRTKSHRESDSENSGSELRISEIGDGEIKIKSEPMDHPIKNGHCNLVDTNSVFVPSSEELEELKHFVREKLLEHHCVSVSELRRLLERKLAASPPGHILSKLMSDQLLGRAAEQAGASLIKAQWPSNQQEEPLYAITKLEDSLDPWRGALFEVFKTSTKLRKSTFRNKVNNVAAGSISETDLTKLLEEYCVCNKRAMFSLKGTCPANS